ncbi:MAG: hypothetical protein WCK67_13360 [bacterium]
MNNRKIKFSKIQQKKEESSQDRNCFLYGVCSTNAKENTPESHKITQFGLEVLQVKCKNDVTLTNNKGDDMEQEEKIEVNNKIKQEKACAVYGRCSEDPFNDLLHDLSVFGLEIVNNKKAG